MDSFDKKTQDEDSIFFLNQIYKSKYVRLIIMMILMLNNIIRKGHTNAIVVLKYNFMSSLLLCCYSLNLHDKDPKRFAFHIVGLKCCLHYTM